MRYFSDPPPEDADDYHYPCGVCDKKVGRRMRAIQCDLCNYWTHIKCDGVDTSHYATLKNNASHHHYCKLCREEHFPFQSVLNDQYEASVLKNVNINENLNLQINPPPRLKVLFNDLNDRNENSSINCEYYDFSKPIPCTNY